MFDHHLMRLNYDAWQKEAENEQLCREVTAGRLGVQKRLFLSIAGLFVSFVLWLGERYQPIEAGQHTYLQREPPRAELD